MLHFCPEEVVITNFLFVCDSFNGEGLMQPVTEQLRSPGQLLSLQPLLELNMYVPLKERAPLVLKYESKKSVYGTLTIFTFNHIP